MVQFGTSERESFGSVRDFRAQNAFVCVCVCMYIRYQKGQMCYLGSYLSALVFLAAKCFLILFSTVFSPSVWVSDVVQLTGLCVSVSFCLFEIFSDQTEGSVLEH